MSDIVLLVASRKGLFEYRHVDGGWSVHRRSFLGDNCVIAMRDSRDGTTYAALDHGHFGTKLHRSDDDGATWSEIACPVYPAPPDGYEPSMPQEGTPIPWRLRMIWALVPGGPDQPGRIWCGTLPGGLFASDDRGESWRLCESLWRDPRREQWFGGGAPEPGVHSICVDPRNSSHVSIGVSCGGVWHTTDDGTSWELACSGMRAEFLPPDQGYEENLQDPHRMVQCRDMPDRLWVQHHNGIFRSDDAGHSWTELNDVFPSSFGFSVAVHPAEPDTVWFVPGVNDEKRIPVDGALVVNRTRDGGRTFEQLRTGLPQDDVWDIAYRHALDVTGDGRTLAFGTTTGNLFASIDGGDSWTSLTCTLPPIYSVQLIG